MSNTLTITNQNLDRATKELWEPTVQKEVLEKNIIVARLLMNDQNGVVQRADGGKYIKKTLDYAELSDGEWYSTNDPLGATSETFLDEAKFKWKNMNKSVTIDLDEMMDNSGEHAVVDLAETIVGKLQKSMRNTLRNATYNPSTTDTGESMQSVINALDHDASPYGYITRALSNAGATYSAGTNDWWQSADLNDFYHSTTYWGYSSQDVAETLSPDMLDRAVTAANKYLQDDVTSNLMAVVGPKLYRKGRAFAQQEQHKTNQKGPMARYGFTAFTLNDVEFVKDPFLTKAEGLNFDGTPDFSKYFFLYNVGTWRFYMHPERSFKLVRDVWQGDQVNGYDRWLYRGLLRCNLLTWQPNANVMQTNVT